MTTRRVVAGLVVVVLVALGWLLVAPQQLGGPVAVVSTYGTSMLPTYTANDLVVVTKASDYDIGDVVAYRSDELGAVVLHRIVDGDEDGYVTQGDNNDWLDPDRPTDDDLMGTARLRIPAAGRLLLLPPALRAGVVVALAGGALFAGGRGRRRRTRRPGGVAPAVQLLPSARRRRSPRPAGADTVMPPSDDRFAWVGWPVATALTAAGLALAAALVAVMVFTRPTAAPADIVYTHRGEFAYTADAPAGTVYPDGEVTTGEPAFLRLVDALDVTFAYSLDGPAEDLQATGQLSLDVADASGWSTRLPLGEEQANNNGELVLEGTLDVPQLRRTLERVRQQTGISSGSSTVTLTADVDVSGVVAEQPVSDEFTAQLPLQLDENRITPQVEDAESNEAFAVVEEGSVTVPDQQPARLEVGGVSVDVTTARVGTVALLGAALLALAVAAAGAARQGGLDEASRIQMRYGSRLVEVSSLQLPAGFGIVDVRDMQALVGLADRMERPVLHHRVGDTHTYVVEGDAAVYRRRVDVTGANEAAPAA